MLVASLADIFRMKEDAYSERKEARDLFDILAILKSQGKPLAPVVQLIKKHGAPKNMERLERMVFRKEDFKEFETVVFNASKNGN